MQPINCGKLVCFLILLTTQSILSATFTVSQDGRGQFADVQSAIDAAGPGDEVVILDAAVYEGQVTIDSTKDGLTLRSENPLADSKPTIEFQDRINVGPTTAEEALIEEMINFDRNGALQVLGAGNVRIEGLIVDGGGVYPFGYEGIWEGRFALQHGNAAITLWVAGESIVRNCELRNAYFGINVKDRNEGGVFANPNPADIDPEDIVPFSGFARTGNHLIEYNRIHDNSYGMFFESTWDMGTTVRYNLFYENHHKASYADDVKSLTSEGNNQGGGAFMFKDHILSPVAIYNNTFYHNGLIFGGNWKAAPIHLVFNNIFGAPFEYWGECDEVWAESFDLFRNFTNRMHNCVVASQQQAPSSSYIAIMNQVQMPQGADEGDLLPATVFPASADVRYVEMGMPGDTKFLSTNPASPDFLTPDWSDPLVMDYIVDQGWEEADVKDPDGSRADLGAIPMGGGRPVDLITIRPTKPIIIDGGTATIGFNITPRIGTMTDLEVTYFGVVKDLDTTSDVFGSDADPISTADIQQISLGTQTVQLGTNTIKVSVSGIGDFAFFEMVVEGTGSDGRKFTTSVGFLPYRKLDYLLDVKILDGPGGTEIFEVYAGTEVTLYVEALRSNGTQFENLVDPTDINLQSRFPLLAPNETDTVSSIPGGIQGEAEVQVVFTKVPIPGGDEYVLVAGSWIGPENRVVPFLGSSDAIKVHPGPADSIAFQDPPSNMCAVVDPGTTYPVKVQAFDKYGNKVDAATIIRVVSTKPDIGKIAANEVETNETGMATFRAQVTNGDLNDTFPLVATLVEKPERTDNACMIVGQPRDRLWIFYGDTAAYNATAELSGCAGVRLPVTIRASKYVDSLPSTDRNTSFTIMLTTGLGAYATESSTELITSAQLVNGEVVIWIQATGKNVSNGTINANSNDPSVVSGERSNINFYSCFKTISHAAYFADNGFGRVTRVEIYYDSALTAEEVPDSIQFFWPNNTSVSRMARNGVDIALDPNDPTHLVVVLSEPFGPEITKYIGSNGELGISYWNNPSTPDAPRRDVRFAIEDSVGPLIASAVLTERLTAGNDTITLNFTETVDFSVVTGNSLILLKDGQEILLNVVGSQPHTNGVAVVAVVDGSANPAEGDSIRIQPAGPIVDAFGNHAHPENRPVPLTLSRVAPDIVKAFYYDLDADGVLETVRVTFNKTVDPATMFMSFSWTGKTTIENIGGDKITLFGTDGMTVDADISTVFDRSEIEGETYANMQVTVTFMDFVENNEKSQTVGDSAAPVLDSVTYEYGELLSDTGTSMAPAHLIVLFTEPVDTPPKNIMEPFIFERDGVPHVIYVADTLDPLREANGGWKYQVLALEPNYNPAEGDLASINVAGEYVIDNAGNVQKNPLNRRVPIKIKSPAFKPVIKIGPNPFNPPEKVRIAIRAITIEAVAAKFVLQANIYDKVGNIVAALETDKDGRRLNGTDSIPDSVIIFWDGTNQNNRIVGNGTYLVVFKGAFRTTVTTGETTPEGGAVSSGGDQVTILNKNKFIGVKR